MMSEGPVSTQSPSLLTISLVTRNNPEDTLRVVQKIRETTKIPYKLWVLDCASDSPRGAENYIPKELLQPQDLVSYYYMNLGFSEANNVVSRTLDTPFMAVITPDIHWDGDIFSGLCEELQKNPKNFCCGPTNSYRSISTRGGYAPDYLEGSCLVVPAWAIRKRGGNIFDPKYFLHWAAADLCLAMRQKGYTMSAIQSEVTRKKSGAQEAIDRTGLEVKDRATFLNTHRLYSQRKSFQVSIKIKRWGAMGDILFLTPLLRAIKKWNPSASIFLEADPKYSVIFAGNPNLSGILPHPGYKHIRHPLDPSWPRGFFEVVPSQDQQKYDYTLEMDWVYERQTMVHPITAFLGEAQRVISPEIKLDDRHLDVLCHKTSEVQEWTQRTLTGVPEGKRVAVDFSPTWPCRRIGFSVLKEITEKLLGSGYSVIGVGHGNDPTPPVDLTLNLYNSTTIPQIVALVEEVNYFIGHDGGLIHIAQAFNVPSAIGFGATLPELRVSSSALHPVQAKDVSCLGCHHYSYPQPRDYTECGRADHPNLCVERLKAEAFLNILGLAY